MLKLPLAAACPIARMRFSLLHFMYLFQSYPICNEETEQVGCVAVLAAAVDDVSLDTLLEANCKMMRSNSYKMFQCDGHNVSFNLSSSYSRFDVINVFLFLMHSALEVVCLKSECYLKP